MTYDVRIRGALHLIEQQFAAGFETQACSLIRVLEENARDERQEWIVVRDRIADLTRHMKTADALDEVKPEIDRHIASLEAGLAMLNETGKKYSYPE